MPVTLAQLKCLGSSCAAKRGAGWWLWKRRSSGMSLRGCALRCPRHPARASPASSTSRVMKQAARMLQVDRTISAATMGKVHVHKDAAVLLQQHHETVHTT